MWWPKFSYQSRAPASKSTTRHTELTKKAAGTHTLSTRYNTSIGRACRTPWATVGNMSRKRWHWRNSSRDRHQRATFADVETNSSSYQNPPPAWIRRQREPTAGRSDTRYVETLLSTDARPASLAIHKWLLCVRLFGASRCSSPQDGSPIRLLLCSGTQKSKEGNAIETQCVPWWRSVRRVEPPQLEAPPRTGNPAPCHESACRVSAFACCCYWWRTAVGAGVYTKGTAEPCRREARHRRHMLCVAPGRACGVRHQTQNTDRSLVEQILLATFLRLGARGRVSPQPLSARWVVLEAIDCGFAMLDPEALGDVG